MVRRAEARSAARAEPRSRCRAPRPSRRQRKARRRRRRRPTTRRRPTRKNGADGRRAAQPVAPSSRRDDARSPASGIGARPAARWRAATRRSRRDEDGRRSTTSASAAAGRRCACSRCPQYTQGYDGPRTDFRETIYWNPSVKTDADGTPTVTFFVSDAVTSFRATAEGVSARRHRRAAARPSSSRRCRSPSTRTCRSRSPSGDTIRLPVTLTNETDRRARRRRSTRRSARRSSSASSPVAGTIHLAAGEKKTLLLPARGRRDRRRRRRPARARARAGLKDELKKKIRVVPLGFPFEVSRVGHARSAGKRAAHDLDLAGALPGSIHGDRDDVPVAARRR